MISFKFTQDERKNFTPAQKIFQYAKENGLNCYNTQFGTQILEMNGNDYTYHHYTITNNGNGTETIEIFLAIH